MLDEMMMMGLIKVGCGEEAHGVPVGWKRSEMSTKKTPRSSSSSKTHLVQVLPKHRIRVHGAVVPIQN